MAAVRRSMSATSRVIPRLVVFDMDGTLTELGGLDFDKIRNRLRCPPGTGILEFVTAQDASQQEALMAIVEEEERSALKDIALRPDAEAVLRTLKDRGVKTAVLTRNCDAAMRDVLARLEHSFDIALSRTFQPCKPSPAPLNHIIKHCGEDATATIMVGDSIDDIQCGNAAGATTVIIADHGASSDDPAQLEAHMSISHLSELLKLFESEETAL